MFFFTLIYTYSQIVCPSSKVYSERRDRAPYIEQDERSPQYLAESGGLGTSRSRKAQPPAMPPYFPANDEEINKRIETVFDTKFGPGLHLFQVSQIF